jgi:Rrf2 family protein
MKLQKNSSLALYSVLEFAADPTRHISAAEIADKYGVSPHHLAKVLSELARAGIVESVRGVGGGYRFTGNVRRLTLMDVIQTFEQPGLPEGGRREPGEPTPVGKALGAVLSEIDEIAKATLSSITLTTMLRLMERQQRGPAESVARRKNNGAPARTRSSDAAHRAPRSRPRPSPATKA